jgi:pyruvate/2-oxoacid:ferredoxin oxidoreductase alpha subunit
MELRYLLEEALENAPKVICAVDAEYGAVFGRSWGGMTWDYRADDAEVLLAAAGSLASEATVAADLLREQGRKVGVLGVRVYRPFPKKEVIEGVHKARLVVVLDKSLSYGHEGPICSDLKSALYGSASTPVVHGYIAGLGGRDVKASELAEAAMESIRFVESGKTVKETGWINCQI